jgi:two-component system response regulator HydG
VLHGSDFSPSKGLAPSDRRGRPAEWNAAWLETVRQAMQDSAGNKSRAAAALGVTRKTLYAWLRQLDKQA